MMVEADLCTPRPSGILLSSKSSCKFPTKAPKSKLSCAPKLFFNTDHQLEAVNATPLYPKPLITALADMKIILLFDKILKTFQMN